MHCWATIQYLEASANLDWWKLSLNYRKFPKYSDTQNICCNHSKISTMWLYHGVMSPNDADGMANSVDSDQTAPLEAVWSGSALFAQTYLSENLGKLWYHQIPNLRFCSRFILTDSWVPGATISSVTFLFKCSFIFVFLPASVTYNKTLF